ncbi:MAG: hypothetical protein QOF51_1404, partial [Chloroflexota bacterium]|nr:hypothetical protein [Chloroflexota bacterium]
MAEHHVVIHQTEEGVTRDLLAWRRRTAAWMPAMVVLAILAVAGLVALISLLLSGPAPYSKWGYPVATLAILLGVGQGGPIIVFITRLAKGFWGIPIRRAAELLAVTGFVSAPLYLLLLAQMPEWYNPARNQWRASIWFHWPWAPGLWDAIFILLLAFTGIALLYFSAIPDWAAARAAGDRGFFANRARWFVGTQKQWFILNMGFVLLGAFYVMIYVYVHVFLTADMAEAMVPGWASSVFPAYHAISGFQSGLSMVLIIAGALMRYGGLRDYISREQFWGASKILLATALLYFYLTWAEFLLPWYGRQPGEIQYLSLVLFGP